MPVELYGVIPSPPVRAVLMTCKQIGLQVDLKELNLLEGEHKSAEYKKKNPNGQIPTLHDNGFYLWESRAIMVYVVTKYGKDKDASLYPKDPQERATVDQMLYFDNSIFDAFRTVATPIITDGLRPNQKHLEEMEGKLEVFNSILDGKKYATGDTMTLADISLVATLGGIEALEVDLEKHANIAAWLERMRELPYYDQLNQKGIDWQKQILSSRIKKN